MTMETETPLEVAGTTDCIAEYTMESWKSMITKTMTEHDDSWDNVVSCTLTEEELCEMFDDDFGCTNGKPFTLWTKTRVYFPVQYDGAEWVCSVSRNPDGNPTEHFGGG